MDDRRPRDQPGDRLPSEGVTFWIARLEGSAGEVVSCPNGRWSSMFTVSAGTYVAQVEAHSGTPSTGPLKLTRGSRATVDAGADLTVTVNLLGSEL
jgi:hypothetical protein